MYGRTLQLAGKNKEALAIFEMNAKKNPGKWPVELGLARAYSTNGDHKKAIEHAKKAVATAPTPANKQNAEMVLKQVEEAAKKK
jgi:Flp pilus assembly protein TadD